MELGEGYEKPSDGDGGRRYQSRSLARACYGRSRHDKGPLVLVGDKKYKVAREWLRQCSVQREGEEKKR